MLKQIIDGLTEIYENEGDLGVYIDIEEMNRVMAVTSVACAVMPEDKKRIVIIRSSFCQEKEEKVH